MTSDVWESGYAAYGLPKERWSRSMLFSVFFRGDKFCPVISLGFFFFWSPRDFFGVLIFAPHSVSELNRTQSDGLSSIEFDLFDWIRFVRKSNSLKVWCSISFDCRTQSNSIHRLSSIEFDWVRFSDVRFTMPGVLLFSCKETIWQLQNPHVHKIQEYDCFGCSFRS